jgi:hypothetical protein
MFVRSSEITFQGKIDQSRIEGDELVLTAAQAFHRARAIILQRQISCGDESVYGGLSLLLLQVYCQAALVPAERGEKTGGEPPSPWCGRRWAPARPQSPPPEFRENQTRGWAHHGMAEFRHPKAGRRRCRH